MLIYTVQEPGRPAHSLDERAESVAFIKEGFSGWGFLLGPFWLFFNGLWLELVIALLLLVGVAAALMHFGLNEDQASGLAQILLMLVVGFEGNSLRRWNLERKGYVFLASVVGKSFEECERRFFDAWLPAVAKPKAAAVPQLSSNPGPPSWGDWPGPAVTGTLPGEIA